MRRPSQRSRVMGQEIGDGGSDRRAADNHYVKGLCGHLASGRI